MELYKTMNVVLRVMQIVILLLIAYGYLHYSKNDRPDGWRIVISVLFTIFWVTCIVSIIRNQIIAVIVECIIG